VTGRAAQPDRASARLQCRIAVQPTCSPTTFAPAKGRMNKTTTKTTRLVCKSSANAVLLGGTVTTGGGALGLYVKGAPSAYASISSSGSKLLYSSKACKATKPPH
jgi:hypothetical protein